LLGAAFSPEFWQSNCGVILYLLYVLPASVLEAARLSGWK